VRGGGGQGWTREELSDALADTGASFTEAFTTAMSLIAQPPSGISDLAIVDAGGSAGAGRIVAAIAEKHASLPIRTAGRGGEQTVSLIIEAESAVEVRTNQGLLAHIDLDSEGMARAAVGSIIGSSVGFLSACGLLGDLSIGKPTVVPTSVDAARRIGTTFPVFVGAGPIGDAIARRAKASFNLNAKTPAFALSLPDAFEIDIHGWGQSGDVTRQVFTLVAIRSGEIDADLSEMFDTYLSALDEVVHDVVTIRAQSDGEVSQIVDAVTQVDLLSLEFARDAEPQENSVF
jgi:hypothetical protein